MTYFTGNLAYNDVHSCVHSDNWNPFTKGTQQSCPQSTSPPGSCCALQGDGEMHSFSGMSNEACGWIGGSMGSCDRTPPPTKKKSKTKMYAIIGGSVAGLVLFIVLLVVFIPTSSATSTTATTATYLAPPRDSATLSTFPDAPLESPMMPPMAQPTTLPMAPSAGPLTAQSASL